MWKIASRCQAPIQTAAAIKSSSGAARSRWPCRDQAGAAAAKEPSAATGCAACSRLAETPDNVGPNAIGKRERKLFPHPDEGPILRIQRVVVGDLARPHQVILVVQRRRLESPVALEVIGAGAALAASIVEHPHAALACPPHHFPVH